MGPEFQNPDGTHFVYIYIYMALFFLMLVGARVAMTFPPSQIAWGGQKCIQYL